MLRAARPAQRARLAPRAHRARAARSAERCGGYAVGTARAHRSGGGGRSHRQLRAPRRGGARREHPGHSLHRRNPRRRPRRRIECPPVRGRRRSRPCSCRRAARRCKVPDAIGVAPSDIVLPRYHGLGPMTGTQLDPILRNLGVTTIVGVGVSVNIGMTNLAFDAVNRGYQIVMRPRRDRRCSRRLRAGRHRQHARARRHPHDDGRSAAVVGCSMT